MSMEKKKLGIILLAALLLRLVIAFFCDGYFSDMLAFCNWAESIFEFGPKAMYTSVIGCDYPPGYLYVLWIAGAVIRVLRSINAGAEWICFVLKIPAIICDILTAMLLYKIATSKHDEKKALLFAVLYLFNPAIIINSSAWGQVDSVLGLFVLLTVYLVYKNKMYLSYLSFCIGFLLKPQIIFIAPIVLFGIIDNVFRKDFSLKKFIKHLFSGIGAILLCVILCLPFGLSHVIAQYADTMSQYHFASLNAYNFWTMLGLNWEFQNNEWLFNIPVYVWGYAFILIVCLLVLYIWLFVYKKKRERSNSYFLLAALLITGVFTFAVRMHERYMYPVLALYLAFCAIHMSYNNLVIYGVISIVHFINVFIVYMYPYSEPDTNYIIPEVICGAIMVFVYICLLNMALRLYRKPKKNR